MKNKLISITAIILTLALLLFTGCGVKTPDTDAETTTAAEASGDVQHETEKAEVTEKETEIVTNEEGETEIVTKEEETTKDASSGTTSAKNLTTEEIVKLFNTSINRVKPEATKVVKNFEKRINNKDKTEIPAAIAGTAEKMLGSLMADDTDPITYSGKEEIKENFIVPQQSYSSKLTTDYVVKATCKDNGSTYEVYFKLKEHKNSTAGVGVGAVCDVVETYEIADKASFIEEFSTTYYNCEITATIDKDSGRVTHIVYSTPLVMNMKVNLFGTHVGKIGFTFIKDYTITY